MHVFEVDRPFEGAALDLVIVPVRAVCRSCQTQLESDDPIVVCTKCDGMDLDLTGGEELILESIEYDGDGGGV
jgi:hydrogenase nickel incorporation protein HypA/HybF